MNLNRARPGLRGDETGQRLSGVLNEILFEVRKPFAMFGKTNWRVAHVGPALVVLSFDHWPAGISPLATATNVRNAMLNLLHDTVPCARLEGVFRKPGRSRAYRRVRLDFHRPDLGDLPTQLVVIESNVAPLRPAWRDLLERAAGSKTHFASPAQRTT